VTALENVTRFSDFLLREFYSGAHLFVLFWYVLILGVAHCYHIHKHRHIESLLQCCIMCMMCISGRFSRRKEPLQVISLSTSHIHSGTHSRARCSRDQASGKRVEEIFCFADLLFHRSRWWVEEEEQSS
jgi:hypothetical protein